MDFRFSGHTLTVTEIHEHPRHNMQVKSHQAEGFVFLASNLVAENPRGYILVHTPDLESLKWPQSYSPIKFVEPCKAKGLGLEKEMDFKLCKATDTCWITRARRHYTPTSVRLNIIWIVKCWQGSFASIHSCTGSWQEF